MAPAVNELAGPRQDLAGHLSIGHGVDTPSPSPLSRSSSCRVLYAGRAVEPGGALARVRAPVSTRLEEKRSTRDAKMAGGGDATVYVEKTGNQNPSACATPVARNRYTLT